MTLIITKLYIGLYLRKVILFCQKKSKLQFNEFINLQFYIIPSIFKKGQRMNGNLLIGLGIVISSGYIYLSMQNINRDFLNIENRMSIPSVTNATQKDVSNIFFKHNDTSTKKEESSEDYYVEELALPTSIQSEDIPPVETIKKVEIEKEEAPIEQQVDDFTEESLIAEALLIESINEQSQEKQLLKEREDTPPKSEEPITPPSQVVTKESTQKSTQKESIESRTKSSPKTVEVIKESQTPVNSLKEISKKEPTKVVKSRETILEDEIKAALEEISAIEENNKN